MRATPSSTLGGFVLGRSSVGWVARLDRFSALDVPLLGRFETSNADGRLRGHSHCFSEDSEAVARL